MEKVELIIKKIRPRFTKILTTSKKFTEADAITDKGLIVSNMIGKLKDVQEIVAVGEMVKDLKPGDLVCLNFNAYVKIKDSKTYQMPNKDTLTGEELSYTIPSIEVAGEELLNLDSRDVQFVIEQYEYRQKEVELQKPARVLHNSDLIIS